MKNTIVTLIISLSILLSQNAYDAIRPFYGFKDSQTISSSIGGASVASGNYIQGYTNNPANIGLYNVSLLQINYINSEFDTEGTVLTDGYIGGINWISPINVYRGNLAYGFGMNTESHFSSTANWNGIEYKETGRLKSKSIYFSSEFSKTLFVGSELKYYSGKNEMVEIEELNNSVYQYKTNFSGWGFVFGLLKQINNQFNFGMSVELPLKFKVTDKYSEWNSNDITTEYSDTWHYNVIKPITSHIGFGYSGKVVNVLYETEITNWKNLEFESNEYYTLDIFDINNEIKDEFKTTISHYFGLGYHPEKIPVNIYFGYQHLPVPFDNAYTSNKKESFSLGLSYVIANNISMQGSYKLYKWEYESIPETYYQLSIGVSLYLHNIKRQIHLDTGAGGYNE